jgi:hypothetical protein
MSTKIYNGYIAKLSLDKLLERLIEVKPKMIELIHQEVISTIGAMFIFKYDCDEHCKVIEKTDFISFYDSTSDKLKETHPNIRFDISNADPETSISVFPLGKKTSLILFYCELGEVIKYWRGLDFVADYHYQNSTDKPDGISDLAWEKRRADWDKVLGGNGWGKPVDYAYCFQVKERKLPEYRDLKNGIDSLFEMAKIGFPDDWARKKRIFIYNMAKLKYTNTESYFDFLSELNKGVFDDEIREIELKPINF